MADEPGLAHLYRRALGERAAIVPHMPRITQLAAECGDCVEFGVRKCHTTLALLMGCSGTVHSYDIAYPPEYAGMRARIKDVVGERWQIHEADTGKLEDIPECDLLLHDSLHDGEHVLSELSHHRRVRKYVVLHDTEHFAFHGQRGLHPDPNPEVMGMREAITRFLWNERWEYAEHHAHSHGLTVLRRVSG